MQNILVVDEFGRSFSLMMPVPVPMEIDAALLSPFAVSFARIRIVFLSSRYHSSPIITFMLFTGWCVQIATLHSGCAEQKDLEIPIRFVRLRLATAFSRAMHRPCVSVPAESVPVPERDAVNLNR